VSSAQTFFVKVNLVSSEPYPTSTHRETLQAVLEFLSGQDVVVGDAPPIDAGSSEEVLRSSSLRQVCDSHRVPLVNLYKTKARKSVSPRATDSACPWTASGFKYSRWLNLNYATCRLIASRISGTLWTTT